MGGWGRDRHQARVSTLSARHLAACLTTRLDPTWHGAVLLQHRSFCCPTVPLLRLHQGARALSYLRVEPPHALQAPAHGVGALARDAVLNAQQRLDALPVQRLNDLRTTTAAATTKSMTHRARHTSPHSTAPATTAHKECLLPAAPYTTIPPRLHKSFLRAPSCAAHATVADVPAGAHRRHCVYPTPTPTPTLTILSSAAALMGPFCAYLGSGAKKAVGLRPQGPSPGAHRQQGLSTTVVTPDSTISCAHAPHAPPRVQLCTEGGAGGVARLGAGKERGAPSGAERNSAAKERWRPGQGRRRAAKSGGVAAPLSPSCGRGCRGTCRAAPAPRTARRLGPASRCLVGER